MFETISMRIKLTAAIMIAGVLCVLSINLGSYYLTRRYFLHAAFDSFTAIREIKKQQIEAYFQQVRNQCHTFARDTMIVNAMKEFKETVYKVDEGNKYSQEQIASFTDKLKQYYKNEYLTRLNPNVDEKRTVEQYFKNMDLPTIILQYFYIAANPNPTGQKDNLNMANDGSAYSKWHGKYHPIIREFLKKFGYYDIFLIDIQTGTIAYTVFKEVDYITSLIKGPFKNTNFAQVFLAAQETTHKDAVNIVDFAYYDPSYGAPAAFIAAPIFDRDKKIGVLAFQFPIDKINQIMTNDKKWKETGLGNSGEMYLIGQDYKMRTVSRFLEEDPKAFFTTLEQSGVSKQVIDKIKLLKTTILIQEINTHAAHEVMRGTTNTILTTNYRNIPVVSSFTPLAIEGLKWGLITEIDESEVVAPVKKLLWAAIGWGILLLFILIIFSIFVVRLILSPLRKIIMSIRNIIRKKDINLREELVIANKDEFAQLVYEINTFIEEVRKKITSIAATKEELRSVAHKLVRSTTVNAQQDGVLDEVTHKTLRMIDIFEQKLATMQQTDEQYHQGIHDLLQVTEQATLFVMTLGKSQGSLYQHMTELQKHDQKLLSSLEKDVFDMRQVNQYVDEVAHEMQKGTGGKVDMLRSLVKALLTELENAVNATRLSSSKLDQAMIMATEGQTETQKITTLMALLKTKLHEAINQLIHNKEALQQLHLLMQELVMEFKKLSETREKLTTSEEELVQMVKKLEKCVSTLDENIKRFSW